MKSKKSDQTFGSSRFDTIILFLLPKTAQFISLKLLIAFSTITLSEYCIPYVKVGGYFVSYKSEKLAEELTAAEKAIHILGGKVTNQVEFVLPKSDIYRNLVVIEKIKATPNKFPRKAGLPSKEPIC